MQNGGCIFELSQAEWDTIARTNRNGDPVTVQVRAIGCDGTNVASSATRQIEFAQEDLVGVLYYWASQRLTIGGQAFNTGGVFRYDFGVRGQSADPVLTPNSAANPNNLCIGCHSVSRDGRQMVFMFDDNDADDEFSDIRTDVYDIAAATPATAIVKNGPLAFRPGYATWNREASEFLLSDGFGNDFTNANARPGAFERISPTATHLGYAQAGTLRGTTPDFAPDDSSVVFAAPPNVLIMNPYSTTGSHAGFWKKTKGTSDDLWFAGASLYTAPWDDTNKALGAPTQLVASDGTNNYYYPSYSPEGSYIAFNFAPEGPNFHNPKARVQLVVNGQATPTPTDLARLNDTGNLTNSWARWAPFVQRYKGGHILWMTMSSTRNYGLRVVNDGKVNCYPPESPTGQGANCTSNAQCPATASCAGGHCTGAGPSFVNGNASNPVCTRTQLWMAAIRLDTAAVQNGQDVSFPAFYLPFQDITTNNHLAQWAERSFSGTCTQDPDCNTGGQTGRCCVNNGCTACTPTPPPPPPVCSADSNCPTGQCCQSGRCGTCPTTGPTTCTTDVDCTNGGCCVSGTCGNCPTPACNLDGDCPGGQCCTGHTCGTCPPPPPPLACNADADCVSGGCCNNGTCGACPPPECTVNSDCASGQCCGGHACGQCPPTLCGRDTDCSNGQCCVAGACGSCPVAACTTNTDCPQGQCCDSGSCGACAAPQCSTCLDCQGQACVNGACGSCTNSSQCCAPLVCLGGQCVSHPQG
jgi:hypothetical protein